MEGAHKLDKKQRISWGVSFGSIALVAGMVSYLGLSNGDKTNNQATFSSSNNTNQQQSNQNTNDTTQSFFDNNSNNSNGFSDNNGNSFNNSNGSLNDGSAQQSQDSFGGHSKHQGGFDTTTGGT